MTVRQAGAVRIRVVARKIFRLSGLKLFARDLGEINGIGHREKLAQVVVGEQERHKMRELK